MNEERWLVSYADFITLLFAFFVVMFASSQVDKKKMAIIASSFDSYVNGQVPKRKATGKGGATTPGPPGPETYTRTGNIVAQALTMAQLAPTKEKLEEVLMAEILSGKVELSLQPRGLVLSLKEAAFFAPGQDTVAAGARPILGKVADGLRQIPGQVRLEGHTDDTPIRSRKFPSNWHLSSARAIAVLKLLSRDYSFPAERLAVAGYGEFHPLDSNSSEQGRTKNRRVDLVILTQAAEAFAPR
jgi:chemotaxis protein MotB